MSDVSLLSSPVAGNGASRGVYGCSDVMMCLLNAVVVCYFCRSLAVGTKSGYKFFSLSSVDKLEQIYECSK